MFVILELASIARHLFVEWNVTFASENLHRDYPW